MKKLLIFCVAAMAMTTVHAATLTLTTSDGSGKSSFEAWDASATTPGDAPSSDNDYVVSGGRYIRVIWNRTFGGKSLSFGKGNSSGALVIQRGNADVGHTIGFGKDGAILENGYWTIWASGRTPTISNAGSLTVTAPESRPFRIALGDGNNTNNAMTINAPIKGAAGTALLLCSGTKPMLPSFFLYNLSADYKGKLIIGGGEEKSGRNSFPVYADIAGALGGSLVVQTNAMVALRYATTTLTVPSLELQSGSVLVARNKTSENGCGKIEVTESLAVEPGAIVRLNTHPYNGSGFDGYDWVVLTLPANKGTIPLENFECPDVEGFPPCTLSTNLVDGVWQLVIRKQAHDVLSVNDSTSTTISQALPSACTNAASWKGGNAPQPGKMYVASNGAGGLTVWPVIRTPYYSNTATPFVFAGDCLALGQGGAIYPCSKDVTFPCLNLSQNTTYVLSLASVPSYLRGKLHLNSSSDAYPQKIQAYMKGLNTVAAEVSGSGTLNIMGRSGSGNPYGDIEFTALNTNFTGRIKVYANVNNVTAGPDDYKHERVFVTDARNLGGPLAEFRADALELADYSVLEARNDVDLNVVNRGVKISGNAGMSAPEDVTLAISNDITYDGTVRKTGAGVLALNGAARVADGASAALSVSEGYVSVGSTNALNGVSTTFADGTYLLVDPAATGDVATFGAVDLSATPFGGTLPVAFTLPAIGNNAKYDYSDVAVCTVADAATAEGLTLDAKKISGHSVRFSTRTNNADGTVTVVADINAKGFGLVVR